MVQDFFLQVLFYSLLIFMEVELIYNTVLISTHIFSDSIIYYCKIMVITFCATQYRIVAYLFYTSQFVSDNPLPLICPPPSSPLVTASLGLYLWVCFCFAYMFIRIVFSVLHISDIIQYLSFSV